MPGVTRSIRMFPSTKLKEFSLPHIRATTKRGRHPAPFPISDGHPDRDPATAFFRPAHRPPLLDVRPYIRWSRNAQPSLRKSARTHSWPVCPVSAWTLRRTRRHPPSTGPFSLNLRDALDRAFTSIYILASLHAKATPQNRLGGASCMMWPQHRTHRSCLFCTQPSLLTDRD